MISIQIMSTKIGTYVSTSPDILLDVYAIWVEDEQQGAHEFLCFILL